MYKCACVCARICVCVYVHVYRRWLSGERASLEIPQLCKVLDASYWTECVLNRMLSGGRPLSLHHVKRDLSPELLLLFPCLWEPVWWPLLPHWHWQFASFLTNIITVCHPLDERRFIFSKKQFVLCFLLFSVSLISDCIVNIYFYGWLWIYFNLILGSWGRSLH